MTEFSATTIKRLVGDTNMRISKIINKLTLVAYDYNVPRVEEAIEELKDCLLPDVPDEFLEEDSPKDSPKDDIMEFIDDYPSEALCEIRDGEPIVVSWGE